MIGCRLLPVAGRGPGAVVAGIARGRCRALTDRGRLQRHGARLQRAEPRRGRRGARRGAAAGATILKPARGYVLGRLFRLFCRPGRAPLGGRLESRSGRSTAEGRVQSRLIGRFAAFCVGRPFVGQNRRLASRFRSSPECSGHRAAQSPSSLSTRSRRCNLRWRSRSERRCRTSKEQDIGARSATSSCDWDERWYGGSTAISAANPRSATSRSLTPRDFPWVPGVEADWKKVRAELDALCPMRPHMPNFQDISKEQREPIAGRRLEDLLLLRLRHQGGGELQALPGDGEAAQADPGDEDGFLLDPGAGQAPAAAPRPLQGRAPDPSWAAHSGAGREMRHSRRHRNPPLGGGQGDDLRRHLRP